MRNLFEAIAEYMSAEGSEARRAHAKKVRIEFDLVQDRMLEMQSHIEALEKDAARYRWLRDNNWDDQNLRVIITMQMNERWDDAIDTAMQSEKGGV